VTATNPGPARVDFHHHLFPTGVLAESVRGAVGAGSGWRFPDGAARWTPQTSLAFMDGLGIQLAVLSLPNDVESALPAVHRRAFARQINTFARQAVDDHPGRFGFFAHLPTPTDVDAALDELAYALDELDADGVTVTNVYGTGEEARSLGDNIFEPLWAELDRRHIVYLPVTRDPRITSGWPMAEPFGASLQNCSPSNPCRPRWPPSTSPCQLVFVPPGQL